MPRALTRVQGRVRLAVYRHFVATGAPPAIPELAASLGLDGPSVRATLRELEAVRALVLDPADGSIAMAHPFAGRPTPFAVETERTRYYANCAWDALAMPALLGAEARIDASCAESAEPLPLRIGADGALDGPGSRATAHIAVPFRRFWDDVFFT